MPNLRIIHDNAADRATISASTTAGALLASNLLRDTKSLVWRASGKASEVITATWAIAETLAGVALPFCNLSPTATIRVQCYDAVAGGALLLDTNTLQPGALACPAKAVTLRGWTAAASASAYSFGGGACARIWFSLTAGVKRMVVTIADPNNLQGYIEASRLVAGSYWSPTRSFEYGAALLLQDMSKHTRNDAGDLMTEIGSRSRKVSISLSQMRAADRANLLAIVRSNGLANPIFFSLFPESTDRELERDHQVYCKLSAISAMALPFFDTYSSPLEVEEI